MYTLLYHWYLYNHAIWFFFHYCILNIAAICFSLMKQIMYFNIIFYATHFSLYRWRFLLYRSQILGRTKGWTVMVPVEICCIEIYTNSMYALTSIFYLTIFVCASNIIMLPLITIILLLNFVILEFSYITNNNDNFCIWLKLYTVINKVRIFIQFEIFPYINTNMFIWMMI